VKTVTLYSSSRSSFKVTFRNCHQHNYTRSTDPTQWSSIACEIEAPKEEAQIVCKPVPEWRIDHWDPSCGILAVCNGEQPDHPMLQNEDIWHIREELVKIKQPYE